MKLIDKDALIAMIDKFMYGANLEADIASTGECFNEEVANAKYKLCKQIKEEINTLEVKEVDLKLIIGWFDHIAQIADDRMTLTNQRMTDAHALDEIKCLAKNSSEFIAQHYKTQKGE